MKKILASIAIVGFASSAFADGKDNWDKFVGDGKAVGETVEGSYKEVPYPVKPLAGTITSPAGNTIYYFFQGLDIIGKEGVEASVKAVVASGNCLKASEHPGQAGGCAIKLVGDGAVLIWNTAGYSVTNVVDAGGEILKDVAFLWADSFTVLGNNMKASGDPVLALMAEGSYIVSFAFKATGVVADVTAATISDTGHDFIDGVAAATNSFVQVPVQLLQPNLKAAGNEAIIGVGYSACTVVDVLLAVPRYALNLWNAADGGARKIEKCLDGMHATAELIRAGKYVPAPSLMNNYEMTP